MTKEFLNLQREILKFSLYNFDNLDLILLILFVKSIEKVEWSVLIWEHICTLLAGQQCPNCFPSMWFRFDTNARIFYIWCVTRLVTFFFLFFRNTVSSGRIDAIVIMRAIKANPSLLSFPFFSWLSDVFGFKFLRSNRTRELFGQRLRLFVFRGYEGKFPDTLLNPFVVLRPMWLRMDQSSGWSVWTTILLRQIVYTWIFLKIITIPRWLCVQNTFQKIELSFLGCHFMIILKLISYFLFYRIFYS